MSQNYRELRIWRDAIVIARQVYELVVQLPADEKFGLTSQMRRCAVSIASNIAEGAGRDSAKEFSHFLSIARGSVSELETQLTIAVEVGLVQQTHIVALMEGLDKLGRGITKLKSSLASTA